jgi:hypothetical protein
MARLVPQEGKRNEESEPSASQLCFGAVVFALVPANRCFQSQNRSNQSTPPSTTNYCFIIIMLLGRATVGLRAVLVKATTAGTTTIRQQQQRGLSASAKVWINKETRVICQGFTGKQVRVKCSGRRRFGGGSSIVLEYGVCRTVCIMLLAHIEILAPLLVALLLLVHRERSIPRKP